MPFANFRTKPCIVQAIQLTRNNVKEIKELIGHRNYVTKSWDPVNLYLETGHGEAIVAVGNWVLRDSNGKYYPCTDSEFQVKYEPALESRAHQHQLPPAAHELSKQEDPALLRRPMPPQTPRK